MLYRAHLIRITAGLLTISILLAFIPLATGQSSLFEYGNDRYIRVELHKPIFENADDVGFLTISNFINAQFPVSNNVAFTAELPFAFSSFDGENETAIGNIGVGINYYGDSGNFKTSISVGIPTASDNDASFAGIFGDPLERFNAMNPYVVPIKVMLNFYDLPVEGFIYRLRTGPEVGVATEDFLDTELYFGLHAMLGYAFDGNVIQGGLSTLTIITEDELDFSERVTELINLSAEFNAGTVRPGIILRIPVDDDLSNVYDLGVGVSLAVILE